MYTCSSSLDVNNYICIFYLHSILKSHASNKEYLYI